MIEFLTLLHNLMSLWLHSFYLEVINHNCFILITALFLIVWLVKKKNKIIILRTKTNTVKLIEGKYFQGN